MSENPSGVPGPVGPEHSGEPAEAQTPVPTTPPEPPVPAQPTQPVGEPSPWSAGYQPQPPVEPPVAGTAHAGEQPWSGVAASSSEPGVGEGTPVGAPFAASYSSGSSQPITEQQPTGYPGYYPATGPQPAPTFPQPAPPRRPTGLILGVAALALVIGGVAGSLGGYLFSQNSGSGSSLSSLDQSSGSSQPASAPAGSVQAVASQVASQVVEIAVTFSQNTQAQSGASGDTGSGVIIGSDGKILTNNHVVADAANGGGTIQVVFANGKIANATILGRDPTTDIAVIQAQNVSGLPIAKLGNSDSLAVGQSVIAIGAPFQLAGTVTEGIVSSLHRPVAAGDSASQETVLDAIQTDAAINPGNSGGALVNMNGEVVGINSAIYSPSSSSNGQQSSSGNVGIGFAIPMNQAKRIATQIESSGQATQTVLGVSVADSVPGGNTAGQQATCESGAIVTNGAQIVSVTAGGPADKAGLKAGAVVTEVNGRSVNSCDGLVAAVHAAAPGDQMKLTLNNGSTVTATLAGQPVKLNG